MSENSAIQWTDNSWNPIRARNKATGGIGHYCEKVSTGCSACYSERMQPRFKNNIRFSEADKDKVELFLDDDVLRKPLSWKKPRMVFVCSMTDLFGEWVPDEWIDEVFAVMALAKGHTFQVLTKRPERMVEYLGYKQREAAIADTAKITYSDDMYVPRVFKWPLSNVWLGFSAENQQAWDGRLGHAEKLAESDWLTWCSVEPLIGPINMGIGSSMLSWCVVGGESGPGARPCNLAWIESIIDQCQDTGVPVFCKQIGSFPVINSQEDAWGGCLISPVSLDEDDYSRYRVSLEDSKGGKMEEWPEHLRVRQFPEVANAHH